MDTNLIIPPGYGLEIDITEEGNIEIRQSQPTDPDTTIFLTPIEARLAIEHIKKLLLELESES